jgi:hypothetical protein
MLTKSEQPSTAQVHIHVASGECSTKGDTVSANLAQFEGYDRVGIHKCRLPATEAAVPGVLQNAKQYSRIFGFRTSPLRFYEIK